MQTINKLNPIVLFVYFGCVISLGMMITHPVFLILSVILATSTSFLLDCRTAKKSLPFYLIAAIGITIVNPLLNTTGNTVLFYYFGGRGYTLEALVYGSVMAMLFLTVACWFSCYNAIISSDKFMYIFGRIIPSTSLLLSMVMRFVPVYQNKVATISAARQSVGKGMAIDSYREKAVNGMTVVSVLTSTALENSILTTISMKSRGYGLASRTTFSVYQFTMRDGIVLITELMLFLTVIIISLFGSLETSFIPTLSLPQTDIYFYIGITAYLLLMCVPSIIILSEEIQWKILKSRI